MTRYDETLYGQACKISGEIQDVRVSGDSKSCIKMIEIKLKHNDKYYLFDSIGKFSGCKERTWDSFIFTDTNIPKIGDVVYLTSQYGPNRITGGKVEYNAFSGSLECEQYYVNTPPAGGFQLDRNLEIMDNVCSKNGIITDMKVETLEKWSSVVKMTIVDRNHKYIVGVSMRNQNSDILGIKTDYPIPGGPGYFKGYYPKIGDRFASLFDEENDSLLTIGGSEYKKPSCTGTLVSLGSVEYKSWKKYDHINKIWEKVTAANQKTKSQTGATSQPISMIHGNGEGATTSLSLLPTAYADTGGFTGGVGAFTWIESIVLLFALGIAGFLKHQRKRI